MYFIELIVKKLTKKGDKENYNPVLDNQNQDYEDCEHTFMPVDSTNKTLSCTKCGMVVKKDELKNKNFFIQD